MQKMLTDSNTTFKLLDSCLLSSQENVKNSKHNQRIKMYRIKTDRDAHAKTVILY